MTHPQFPLNRTAFLRAALVFLAAVFPGMAAAEDFPADAREALLKSTVRIRYDREEGSSTVTGHGTAFGMDLSQYGFAGRRWLLTAAHNVLDDNREPYDTLKIEIRDGIRAYWSRCRVVAWDADLDLCLVEAGDDMPGLLTLADGDVPVGRRLVLAGSPRGAPVQLFSGTLRRKFERGTVYFRAAVPFDHGDSGGPMVDAASGRVIGVAVAGVSKNGDLDHNIGLFVPLVGLMSFLDAHRRGTPVPSPLRSLPVAAETVVCSTAPASDSLVVASSTPLAAPVAEHAEPVPAHKGPTPDQMVAVKAAPIVAAETPSPVLVPTPGQVEAQKPMAERADSQKDRRMGVAATKQPGTGGFYVVQKGDTLTRIARQYSVSVDDIARFNGLEDPDRVLAGARLLIPAN